MVAASAKVFRKKSHYMKKWLLWGNPKREPRTLAEKARGSPSKQDTET